MATKWSEIKHKGEDTPEKRERMEQLRERLDREREEFDRTGFDPYAVAAVCTCGYQWGALHAPVDRHADDCPMLTS